MNVTVSKEEISKELQELIPIRFLFRQILLLKCMEEEEVLGAAILEKMGNEYQLSWIWVKTMCRRLGAGGKLLDAAIQIAKKQGAERVSVVYGSDAKSAAVLNYMLAKRMFELMENSTATIRMTKQQILESPLFQMPVKQAKQGVCIFPLQHLTPQQMRSMIREYERRNIYLVSRADYLNADRRHSMVLVIGEKLGGLTLVQPAEEEGHFILDLLYLDKSAGADGIRLLRETAEALFVPMVHFKSIEFACVEESALSLAKKLSGQKKTEWKASTEGTLWI